LPEHDIVVIDEAHELVDRATTAVTDELTVGMVERASRRIGRYVTEPTREALATSARALDSALAASQPGRAVEIPLELLEALVSVRDASHQALTDSAGRDGTDGSPEGARVQARAAVDELVEITERIVGAGDRDVVWVSKSESWPPSLWRAPLSVAGLLRDRLFGEATVILTSATLELGGSFDPVAGSLGLTGPQDTDGGAKATEWTGIDVGSPFDYGRQAILYIASHLPPPGRDGLRPEVVDEIARLVDAAGGRTLGLFSSVRAAEECAVAMRERTHLPVLCQGDDSTAELVRQFAADPGTCLFGTLSLWQGVDVPGDACQLVVIDRIPFPRPDDPLVKARQDAAGPAGFMAVSASSAALLLAQGAGRLIRSRTDRGVVAVLDPRLSTARYGAFLRRSLPPFWCTTDPDQVERSLRALRGDVAPS
jgi:ATP-dependent DNA helicase DinG